MITTAHVNDTKDEVALAPILHVSMNAEMSATLAQLSRELGISQAATIVKAITLLQIAAQAKREGKAFGIADDAEVLSDEIVGI